MTPDLSPPHGGPDRPAADVATTKSARTRRAIIETALQLFRERGYEDTTMRAIAAEAGVSVGSAYYYFASKEHLIQGFYDQAQVEHAAAALPVLRRETDLEARVRGVVTAWIDVMEPYRSFAGGFFRNASDPTSPLSPFSPESRPARDTAIRLWRDVVDGSSARIPRVIRSDLPELLWLYLMGVVLYWVHDPTDGAARTRLLAERTSPMVVRAISLARLPLLRATVTDIIQLLNDLKTLGTPEAPQHGTD